MMEELTQQDKIGIQLIKTITKQRKEIKALKKKNEELNKTINTILKNRDELFNQRQELKTQLEKK